MDLKTKIAIGVFGAVLLYAISRGFLKRDKGQVVDSSNAAKDGSAPSLSTEQYKNKAINIRNSLADTSGQALFGNEYYNIITDLLQESDSDLIEIANAYARLYPTQDYPTLYGLLQSVYTWAGGTTYALKYKLLERMKNLGL